MSGQIIGLADALKAFEALGASGKRESARAVAATAEKVRTDAIGEIQRGVKTGRTYHRGGDQNLSGTHKASAPGEAPATDTGALVSSIKAKYSGVSGEVYSRRKQAFWLEFGTTKMAERPFLRPALKNNEQFFIDQLAAGLDRAAAEFNQ